MKSTPANIAGSYSTGWLNFRVMKYLLISLITIPVQLALGQPGHDVVSGPATEYRTYCNPIDIDYTYMSNYLPRYTGRFISLRS